MQLGKKPQISPFPIGFSHFFSGKKIKKKNQKSPFPCGNFFSWSSSQFFLFFQSEHFSFLGMQLGKKTQISPFPIGFSHFFSGKKPKKTKKKPFPCGNFFFFLEFFLPQLIPIFHFFPERVLFLPGNATWKNPDFPPDFPVFSLEKKTKNHLFHVGIFFFFLPQLIPIFPFFPERALFHFSFLGINIPGKRNLEKPRFSIGFFHFFSGKKPKITFSMWEFFSWISSQFFPFFQSEHFSFLGINNQSNLTDMRCRTTFYTALGRLLMVDLGKIFQEFPWNSHLFWDLPRWGFTRLKEVGVGNGKNWEFWGCITNLKYWGRCEPITSKTLQLLNDLSIGYPSEKIPKSSGKLVKLSAVQFMLNNHTSEHFSFLGINNQSNLTDMRCRTTFYTALGRLLMVDLGEDEDQYEQFMLPLTAAFEAVAQMFSTNSFNEQERTLVGLVRDLRGIAFAFNAKTSFMMLFEWIYPSYMPILQRAIELWYHDPACTTPVLKLMAELVHNRSQRLQFDVSSPNGILLFRETSKMITTYGNRILTLGEVPKDQVYALKLKGISICFSMLKAALSGSYVNFGVFRLYGDDALDNALQTFIKLLLSIPHSDLLDYPKLSQSYYSLLEVLTQDHMNFIASLEPHVIMYILSSISEGLTALGNSCCSFLPFLGFGEGFSWDLMGSMAVGSMGLGPMGSLGGVQGLPLTLGSPCQMLSTVLNIIIFEDCRNQWSMSRPLLGLILLNEKVRDPSLLEKECWNVMERWNVMEFFSLPLPRFTQNLSAFRREVNDSMKNSSYGVNSNDMMS
uniref:Exportin-7/Ran-binding protein 17 TPR repeats domain-containing protein n=1 Tax=Zonotrichia albicollis TaxID=44394 RepID=A0A8D2MR41_ZONAL